MPAARASSISCMVPLGIFCLIRKSSSVRAITSTMALPMPRTSKRVAAISPSEPMCGESAAHYSGRVPRGNLTPRSRRTWSVRSAKDGVGRPCHNASRKQVSKDGAPAPRTEGRSPMSLARDVTTVGSATLVSRLLGFFRDVGVAAVLGAGVASDAFLAVLQIANFFRRLLAEGALNAAFVPLWLRRKATDGGSGAHRFLLEVLAAMLLAVGALTLMGLVLAPGVIDVLAPGF